MDLKDWITMIIGNDKNGILFMGRNEISIIDVVERKHVFNLLML